MKNLIFILSFFTFALVSCEKAPKGNPTLVKQAEKLAELGCACQDVRCLHDIKVDGKGVAAVFFSKLDDLTKEEKKKFYAASNQYMRCESKLNKKVKK